MAFLLGWGMNALIFEEFGKPQEVLSFKQVDRPALEDGEVRLKVLASPLNPADLNLIEGTYGVKPPLPASPGIEGCGEVVESSHPDYATGDRVMLLHRSGMWSEEVVVPATSLFKLPPGIDPLQAAMLKVNPATALQMLTAFRPMEKGDWVVQNAANSGVGRSVIQVAKSLGLRTINLVRRESLFAELKDIGADHVVLDDASAVDAAKEICGDKRPLLALNAVGGDSALRLMNILGTNGAHVTYGAMGRKPLKVPNGLLIFKNLEIRGFWLTRWIDAASRSDLEHAYGFLAQEVAAGRLTVPVDSEYPLKDFATALARLDSEDRHGKVLFTPGR